MPEEYSTDETDENWRRTARPEDDTETAAGETVPATCTLVAAATVGHVDVVPVGDVVSSVFVGSIERGSTGDTAGRFVSDGEFVPVST